MLTLENKTIRIAINPMGGSLVSVFDKERNEELLWTPDERYWKFCDVVIFPLMGKPQNGYEADGATYEFSMPHGVARTQMFEVREHGKDILVLELRANERTMAEYPFEFILKLTYRLEDKKFSLTYEVISKNGVKMPFQIGAHVGFRLPEGRNTLVFDKTEQLRNYPMLPDGKISPHSVPFANSDRFDISEEIYAEHRSIVLDKLASRTCTLCLANGVKLRYDLGGAPHTTVWALSNGGRFVCVEPWWGICESPNTPRDIYKKECMNFAESEPVLFTYSVEIL